MKKYSNFYSLLMSGLLSIGLWGGHLQAQGVKTTAEKEWGLQKVTFDVLEGTVTVNLPDDIRGGDQISGTVYADIKGKNDKEKKKNQAILEGMVVEVASQTKAQNGLLRWIVPSATGIIELLLKNAQGAVIGSQLIRTDQDSTSSGPITPDPLNPGVRIPTQPTNTSSNPPSNQPPVSSNPTTPTSPPSNQPPVSSNPTTPTSPPPNQPPVNSNPTTPTSPPPNQPPVNSNPTTPTSPPPNQPPTTNSPTTGGIMPSTVSTHQVASVNQVVDCEIPDITQSGRPMVITGQFDGNSDNTSVEVNGQERKILAQSPRKTIVEGTGTSGTLYVKVLAHKEVLCEGKIQNVGINLSADVLNLKKDQTTPLRVLVTGLSKDMPSLAHINIVNLSPTTVGLSGGNQQTFEIPMSGISTSGEFLRQFTVTGITPGNFKIKTEVKANPKQPQQKCSCKIGSVVVKAIFSIDGADITHGESGEEVYKLPRGKVKVKFEVDAAKLPCGNCVGTTPCLPKDIKIEPAQTEIEPGDLTKEIEVKVTWKCVAPNCSETECTKSVSVKYNGSGNEVCDCGHISYKLSVSHAGSGTDPRFSTKGSAEVIEHRLGGSSPTIKLNGDLKFKDGDVLNLTLSDVSMKCWCKKGICNYTPNKDKPDKVEWPDDGGADASTDNYNLTLLKREGSSASIKIAIVNSSEGIKQCVRLSFLGKCASDNCKAKDVTCSERFCIYLGNERLITK